MAAVAAAALSLPWPTAEASDAWMGIKAAPLTEEERASVGLKQPIGLRVSFVTDGGPAWEAGLQAGDILLALHDAKVGAAEEVAKILSGFRPGQGIRVIFLRDGKLWDGSLILGERDPTPAGEANPRRELPTPLPLPEAAGEEDIGSKVREILGEKHFETLSKLARDFGYEGRFTRRGLKEFFGRIGFDERAMKDNLKRMGVEKKRIEALIELLEGGKRDRELAKSIKGKWTGCFHRGRVQGTIELQVNGVDRLGNLKGRLTIEYGRVRLSSNISGRLSSGGRKIAYRTHGVGGFWTFEGEKSRGGSKWEGRFNTVGTFGAVRGREGTFHLERK
ncbi:MAG: PDZ domain-containing protein [Planctomycetota bacterium]